MRSTSQLIICSAQLESCDFYTNQQRNKALYYNLLEIGVRVNGCKGVYKGVSELSFLVQINNNEQFEAVKNMAFQMFEQESILYQEISGLCSLLYKDKDAKKLGKLIEINHAKALTLGNYTEIGGRYYATT